MTVARILTLFFICLLTGCVVNQSKNTPFKVIENEKLYHSNKIEFKIISEWVKDKRIVALGESTHGIGEFYTLKSEIIQFLNKQLGYEILAMEAGFADINLAWLDIDNLSPKELRNKTLFGNFKCQEIEPLFQYIKERSTSESPLIYSGFDTQISGDYYENNLQRICNQLNLGIDIANEFSTYSKIYQSSFEEDSINFVRYKNDYQSTIKKISSEILKNQGFLQQTLNLSKLDIKIILRNLDNQHKAVNYSFLNKFNDEYMHQGIIIRDQLMAENLKWITDTLYPNKKIIIWAHNGHIGQSGINNYATKMMGEHLSKMYSEDYFSIGLFAYKGKTHQHWTGKSIEFKNSDSTAIENIMQKNNNQYSYQIFNNTTSLDSVNWYDQEVTALEIENGGPVSFVPSKRFDAAITIYNGDIPTF